MAKYDLLDKTELSIDGILLENANLIQIADVVAEVFGIKRNDLLVTDVRGENLVIDILKKGLGTENIVGKEGQLLQSLSKLPGVRMREDARVDSRGLLSWVSLDPWLSRRLWKNRRGWPSVYVKGSPRRWSSFQPAPNLPTGR